MKRTGRQVRKRWKEGKFKTKQHQQKQPARKRKTHVGFSSTSHAVAGREPKAHGFWFCFCQVFLLNWFSFRARNRSDSRMFLFLLVERCERGAKNYSSNGLLSPRGEFSRSFYFRDWLFRSFLFLLFGFPRFHVFFFGCVCRVVVPSFSTVSFCNCVVINRYNFSFSLYFFLSTNNF